MKLRERMRLSRVDKEQKIAKEREEEKKEGKGQLLCIWKKFVEKKGSMWFHKVEKERRSTEERSSRTRTRQEDMRFQQ